MSAGLPVSNLINVSWDLGSLSSAFRNFGVLLTVGDSTVIPVSERLRLYNSAQEVATDFGLDAPEYSSAALYFSQVPAPNDIYIGRWVRTATKATLTGGALSSAEQLISAWNTISNGSLKITVNGGSETSLTGLDFTSATNMTQVAAVLDAALASCTVEWAPATSQFTILTVATGAAASLTYATTGEAGTSVAAKFKFTSDTASDLVATGYDAETPAEAVLALANKSNAWYGVTFAAGTMPSDSEYLDVAEFIESASPVRIFGITSNDADILDAEVGDDLASQLKDLARLRTCIQYSANIYAISSLFGKAFSVNFDQNKSTIDLMYKTEPGVIAADLTTAQAATLKDKRCNVYANYDNNTAIIQYGVMSGPAYFDEVHGLDWLQNQVQTNVYNLLYTSKTKIPQTDSGINQIYNSISQALDAGINNGLIAPGVWNSDGFGQLSRGDYLENGFYIYTQPIALQTQSTREQRISTPFKVAVKLAGAVQTVDVLINVNR